ncbi:MAG: restriction endonuclease [Candidatus Thorarchaeota archaeon]
MTKQRVYEFDELETADLIVDAVYKGGTAGTFADDPLAKRLLPGGTQGGFRYKKDKEGNYCFVVLFSSLDDSDWPDRIDKETGLFEYFGDNKTPGKGLLDTPRKGNSILEEVFGKIHSREGREQIPPFFVFTRGPIGRDVVFQGLAAPGFPLYNPIDYLVAVWKVTRGVRFKNYKASFTILDEEVISRDYITSIIEGADPKDLIPEAWHHWVRTGKYNRLTAEQTREHRTPAEQYPDSGSKDEAILHAIHEHFKEDPFEFEPMAAKIVEMMDNRVVDTDVTRRRRDGGRDVLGEYRLGHGVDDITVEFAVEAKCKKPGSSVRVGEISRLISRLRHRQFGVLVTTSHLAEQAYQEIREDRHPVIVVSGIDLVRILRNSGYTTIEDVQEWLWSEFPIS